MTTALDVESDTIPDTDTSTPEVVESYPTKVTDLSHMILTQSVRDITGLPDANGRPGQLDLMWDIARSFNKRGRQVSGAAPVGVGKSVAALSPACASAILDGKRTVISTESLSLQSQIIEKDAPVVVAAAEKITGNKVKVAVLKGWSNYACALKTMDSVYGLLKDAGIDFTPVNVGTLSEKTRVVHLAHIAQLLTDNRANIVAHLGATGNDTIDLFLWSTAHLLKESDRADRASYGGATTNAQWSQVSVSSDECIGAKKCPMAALCVPTRMRESVADADIIVTNHAMLSVQAAHNIPVVVGNYGLGQVDNIIVDEAHTLPDNVRNQGSSEVSKASVVSVVRGIASLFDVNNHREAQDLTEDGGFHADNIDHVLKVAAKNLRPGAVEDIGEDEGPLLDIAPSIEGWLGRVSTLIKPLLADSDMKTVLSASRLKSRIDTFGASLETAITPTTGVARWIESPMDSGRGFTSVKTSPVAVGGLLRSGLWTADVMKDEIGDYLIPEKDWLGIPETNPESDTGEYLEAPRYPLSVVAISGTLPSSVSYELGMKKKVKKYPSPFADAYGGSLLFVPRAATDEDLVALGGRFFNPSKPRLDANSHPTWAVEHMTKLVRGAGGRSLILAAKADSGRYYADMLRRLGAQLGFTVFSQWDGVPVPRLVEMWKADERSVLVGTKSLMTGTDAPGVTCSLVVLDRVPRKPTNPVDDARVGLITESMDLDRWSADRMVYAQDAALLVEQCAGRAIRSGSDRAVVAVLDPRLLKSGRLSYPEATRKLYMDSLESFVNKTADIDKAVELLEEITGSSSDVTSTTF